MAVQILVSTFIKAFYTLSYIKKIPGGTLKIYGEALCKDVPYKTLLLSIRDCAGAVVREMLDKYGLTKSNYLLTNGNFVY